MSKITLRNEFKSALLQIDNEYDLVALCYRELLFYKPRAQTQFVTGFIDYLHTDPAYGQHTQNFKKLRSYLTKIAYRMDFIDDDPNSGYGLSGFVEYMQNYLENFTLPQNSGCTTDESMAIVFFFVLEALDAYIRQNIMTSEQYGLPVNIGPLNKNGDTLGCFVYLKERSSFLDGAYSVGKKGFRKPLRSIKLGDKFTTVQIINKRHLVDDAGIPVIIHIHTKTFINEKKIRICCIPYIGFDTFLFHNVGNPKPCEPGHKPQGLFYVDYSKLNEAEQQEYVLKLLEFAIIKQANIIVFPEFIMSTGMLSAVKSYLKSHYNDKNNSLLFVFAGSTFEQDKNGNWNNILHIISAKGDEIGKYYKYSPFYQEHNSDRHSSNTTSSPSYFYNCELLSNPGLKCTLLDVDGIGRILPAICRDVIDGEYTRTLAEAFHPSMIITPAWSPSVKSFDSRLLPIADTLHSASLLCNCCNAVKTQSESPIGIGAFYLPQKQGTAMKSEPLLLSRNPDCQQHCREVGGCIFMVEIDFSQGMPTCKPRHLKRE